jgi:hypothetical protein
MNERIRELMKQATDTIEIVNSDTGITHHRDFFDQEKFAKLIAQECAELCSTLDGGENMFSRGIRKHFGVEE